MRCVTPSITRFDMKDYDELRAHVMICFVMEQINA